jgi:hypothetical protein
MTTTRQFENLDLILFSLTPDFSPVVENARTLKAVSTASRAMDKPLQRFLESRLDFHPAEAGC